MDARMRQYLIGPLIALLAAAGCSRAQYTAAGLPSQFAARPHIGAQYIDLSAMRGTTPPADWLQPGDQVEVTVATGIERGQTPQWNLTVDPRGGLDVPLIGYTPVAGVNPAQAAERIRSASIERGIYVDPKVTVSIAEKRAFQIAVLGAVNKPATYEIPATSCDLLTALTMAEGIAEDASRHVQIKHSPTTLKSLASQPPTMGPDGVALVSYDSQEPPPAVVDIDLSNIEALSPESLRLYDGSVVHVQRERERKVSVLGLVRDPQQVEMPPGQPLTLLEAVAAAGGTTLSIADKVLIVRNVPDRPEPIVIKASLKKARAGAADNIQLTAGDVVTVEETAATVMVQTVRSFFRIGFSTAIPGF
jgi:polysaccharide export outer membrane protein